MAAITSADDWEKLLWSLMAMDNDERNRAETLFAQLKQHSDATLSGLVQVVHSTRSDDVRGLAAVLLRRVLLRDAVSLWPNASDGVRHAVKQELLAVLHSEENRSIRRKVCDTVGELASSILDDAQWDDLLPTLLAWIDAPNTTLRETTLRVFEMIAMYIATMIEASVDDTTAQFEVTVLSMLVTCMGDATGRVALNAIRALSMLLISMDTIQIQREDLLAASIPAVLAALHRMLQQQQFDDVMETLEVLIEVVEPHAAFFKPCLKDYVATMVTIADASGLAVAIPDGCRQLAMEFLVSLAEHAPGACRKLAKNTFVNAVYPVAFKMMLELQDVATWSVAHCDDDEAALASHEISNFDVGSEALERLVAAIGARKSLPKCFALIQEYATNADNWVYRHAALVGLCQILEILSYDNLDAIVHHLLTQAYDAHPRVCCTAVDVIGQMAVDQGPQFQDAYHAQALAVLAHYLEDATKPRLQAHAATALRQFIDMCQPHVLAPYLEPLLQQLFALLQSAPTTSSNRVVQEQAITAVSSIATVAGDAFRQYYSAVMPSLQQILLACLHESTTTGSPGSFTLGGITLECISLIGLAVGKDTFGADAVEIMKIMAEMQNTPKIVGNEWIRTYLLQAWARCCKCLGKDFSAYLPVVMPTLLFAAMQQAEFEVDPATFAARSSHDSEFDYDDGASTSTDNDDIQIAHVNDRCLSIRTSVLEEKATACELLTSLVTDLEETFFPYAEQVTQVLAPLMTDSVHSDIRASSIRAMPALVQCVALASANTEAVKQIVDFTLGRLVLALTSEPELELVVTIMQSMTMCLTHAQAAPLHAHVQLNDAQLRELVNGLLLVLGDSFQRRAMRRAQQAVDDNDEFEDAEPSGADGDNGDDGSSDEGEGDADALEQELQFVLGDTIGGLAKSHGAAFFPVFEATLWDKLVELAAEHCLPEDRKLALYILDDVLEYCGAPAVARLDSAFLPLLLDVLRTSDGYAPVVQAAAYGIGICARVGGDRFAPHAETCLTLLRGVLMHPKARDAYNLNATDNAVSAFGLICEHQSSVVDAATLFPQWLSMLPLRGDVEESVEVTKRLLALVRDRNDHVVGKDWSHLGAVVAVFADVVLLGDTVAMQCGDDVATELRESIRATLAALRATVPDATMASAWGALRGPQQAALHSLFV